MYQQLEPDHPPSFRPLALLGAAVMRLLGGSADPERSRRMQMIVDSLAGGVGWVLNARYGYGGHQVTYDGNPSVASAELGHAFRQLMVEDCLALVESVARGERRAEDVRSVASDPIIIHPLFWRRLALATGALLALSLFLRGHGAGST
jgi:hypothetical protein